jgi:nucleoside permease NupC
MQHFLRGLDAMTFILFLAFLLSTNRRAIRPRTVLLVAMAGEREPVHQ